MSLIIKELLQIGTSALEKAGCMDSRIDAELIMRFLLKLNKQELFIISSSLLDEKRCEAFFKLIDIRAGGTPVQYITGEQEFMGITFQVNENVLIPRQDTETLVEEIISDTKALTAQSKSPKGAAQSKPAKGGCQILDLCCGSGAIGISLCKLIKNAKVTASDVSGKAVAIAKENAKNAGVIKQMKFAEGDLFHSLRRGIGRTKYHIIASNPPYIRRDIIPTLQREIVEHEPLLALDGGVDGLDFYHRIIMDAPDFLKPKGMLYLEIGYDQGPAVCDMARDSKRFEEITIVRDLAGHDRVVKMRIVR